MKVLISYLLLSVFLFNTIGYIITFKVVQLQIKREVKRELKSKIKSSDLYAIRLSSTEYESLQWIEKEREFVLNGKMYDIVKTEYKNGVIILSCIDDKQEKKLFANLEDHISKYISDNKSSSKRDIKLNDTPTKYFQTWIFSIAQRFPKSIIHSSEHLFSIQELDIDPAFPPPRII